MLRYKATIKDNYLAKTRSKTVLANNSLEAHKAALSTVNLAKEDIVRITDQDGTVVFNVDKGFLSKF